MSADDNLPAPLVPGEVNLTDFPFVPLYIERLRKSKAWLICKRRPELAYYLMNLWMRAWHESPAGSIEADEDVLADAAMCEPRKWPKLRVDLLRGWVKCSDGRLYHPVVAELAMSSWAGKMAHRLRTKAATEARAERKRNDAEAAEQRKRDDERNGQRDVARNVHQGRGRGIGKGIGTGRVKGEGKGISPVSSLRSETSESKNPSAGAPPAATGETWAAYSEAYRRRHGVEPIRNAKVNSMLASLLKRLPVAEAPRVAEFFVSHNRQLYVAAKHPVDLLLRDAEGLRTEWATGRPGTETEARQADRTQATGNVFGPLIDEARQRKAHGSE